MTKKVTAPKTTISWLLYTVNSFLSMHPDMSPETFGWQAIKDTSLVERLRSGGDVTTRKLDAIISYIHNFK